MSINRVCCAISFLWLAALAATIAEAAPVRVLQVEADGSSNSGEQYAPINFAGVTPQVSGGITYHALSDPGSETVSTYSSHASTVRNRLLAADGVFNPVNTIYCQYVGDFLNDYVKTSDPSTMAVLPESVDNSIKVVNHSWVGTYDDATYDRDAVRRMDYMIRREDLVMTSGAVSGSSSPTPLAWASRNGIAVRGTQGFYPSGADGIGKVHADLWGPKTGTGIDEAASYETPGVAGYAAALIDVADGYGWDNGVNGIHHEVVKSILMTGADKTAFTSNGFTSWTNNGVNNLDNLNGAGRADYDASLAVLVGGPQGMADVSGNVVNSPIVTQATSGWWYEDSIDAYGDQALILDLADETLTDLTATLVWDVTQEETVQGRNTYLNTDTGMVFANLDLELLPVTYDGGTYALGSSLGYSGLISQSTDDNVEHLYFTDALAPGLYALVVSNNSDFAWNYGLSYDLSYGFTPVPEPGTLGLLFALFGSICCFRRRKVF